MTPAQRCDEIIRMIDEVLDGTLHPERGPCPTPSLVGASIDLPLRLTHLESWTHPESWA